jgi:arylsulfatase A-like enzyme
VPLAPGQVVDGASYLPLLRGAVTSAREAIYWHYPHYHPGGATPYSAVRAGDWKLIEFFEDDHVELYHLHEDPEEKRDLAATMPERVRELRQRLHTWRGQVGAQLPSPNPDYDPSAP